MEPTQVVRRDGSRFRASLALPRDESLEPREPTLVQWGIARAPAPPHTTTESVYGMDEGQTDRERERERERESRDSLTRGQSAGVEVGVGLQEAPEVAAVGDRVLEHRRREAGARLARDALQDQFLEEVLDASREVDGCVLVDHTAEPDVRHPAQEAADRQLEPGARPLGLLELVPGDGVDGRGAQAGLDVGAER
jgi:hypothetical protein